FDIHAHQHSRIELYGTEGSLSCPDPNTFGGPVSLWTPGVREWKEQALSHLYTENFRCIGVADMALALQSDGKSPHRTSGALAYHVLEAMHAFETASTTGKQVE